MASFTTDIVIGRPVEDVFAVITNPALDHRWSSAVVEAKLTSPGPVGVGTTAHYIGSLFGWHYDADWEITEFEPNRRFVALSSGSPMIVRATQALEPVPGGTRLTVTYDMDLSRVAALIWPLMRWYGTRRWDQALRTLKGLMEANAL
jgi:uncharacterized protein YndB with AHSA1/START domain